MNLLKENPKEFLRAIKHNLSDLDYVIINNIIVKNG